MIAKRHEETFGSDGNILHLDCGGGNVLNLLKLMDLSFKKGESHYI